MIKVSALMCLAVTFVFTYVQAQQSAESVMTDVDWVCIPDVPPEEAITSVAIDLKNNRVWLHDLPADQVEGATGLEILSAKNSSSGGNIEIRAQLVMDLDGTGDPGSILTMDHVISIFSLTSPASGEISVRFMSDSNSVTDPATCTQI